MTMMIKVGAMPQLFFSFAAAPVEHKVLLTRLTSVENTYKKSPQSDVRFKSLYI